MALNLTDLQEQNNYSNNPIIVNYKQRLEKVAQSCSLQSFLTAS